jgi:DNA-directed RNA polymerase subunit RPC12/RpoP
MTQAFDEKLGEMSSIYCPACEEERTFVWALWNGDEYYGYPPELEYGWKCSACGSEFREPAP